MHQLSQLTRTCRHPRQVVGLDFASEMLEDAAARQAAQPSAPRYGAPME